MRLWDYRLLKVLPDKFIIAQWRECIAIKRQWEKGTLKHRLVSYVMDYDKRYFRNYILELTKEMYKRNINFKQSYMNELIGFANYFDDLDTYSYKYPEHNDRYLKQCLYNLQEKANRGIITPQEWQKIEDKFGGVM